MTLGELLSLLRESILNDRSDRTSGSSDYLWTNATLVTYIQEAQRRFAVHGLVLRDASTLEVTRVTLVEGQTIYPLHEAVLGVVSVRVLASGADLQRVGHSFLNAYQAPTESWIDPASLNAIPAGAPLGFSTDEGLSEDDAGSLGKVTLRVYPEPSAAAEGTVLALRVVRKPIDPLRVGNLGAVPEIPEDHHIEMLDYAAYLALRIVDDDAGSPKRAEEFRQSFEAHVRAARNIATTKLFTPVGWGFGRGGFAWSS